MLPQDNSAAVIVYDGDCPFCRSYISLMKLREAVGKVDLVDARAGGGAVNMLNAKGFDLNEGMAVIFGDKIYYGADAIVFISIMTHPLRPSSKMLAMLLRNKTRATIIYPIMKLGRQMTLRMLGVPDLPNKFDNPK
jgi:predicted DCC family thiol-disulfide oxidoreductase YuxK